MEMTTLSVFSTQPHTTHNLSYLIFRQIYASWVSNWEENIVVAFHRLTRTATEKEQNIVTRESLHRDFHLSLIGTGLSDWHQFYVRLLNLHGERYRRTFLPDRIRDAD